MTTKVRMSDEARNAATSLAVAYQAYLEASDNDAFSSIVVWGPMLLNAQTATGVKILSPDNVKRRVAVAEAKLKSVKMKTVRNIMSGKEVSIPVDTPACCDPSTETYWSM